MHIKVKLLFTAILTAIIMMPYSIWQPLISMGGSNPLFVANWREAVPITMLFAHGLSTIVMLFLENRKRYRRIFLPNKGRIIGAASLAFFTPLVVMDWMPLVVGPMILMFFPYLSLGEIIIQFGVLSLISLAWYPISCLIIAGTPNKWLRFGRFCLMFWSACAALILMFGVIDFSV